MNPLPCQVLYNPRNRRMWLALDRGLRYIEIDYALGSRLRITRAGKEAMMNRSRRFRPGWISVTWLLLVGVPPGHAQSAFPEFTSGEHLKPPYIAADILTTRGTAPDSARVDCVYRLANDLFIFVKSDGGYTARYELNLLINDNGYQIIGETVRDSIVVSNEADTHLVDKTLPKIFSTALPPGKYELVLKVLDLESYDEYEMKRRFEVPDYYDNDLSISDIQFASLIETEPAVTAKGNALRVVPNLDRTYGEDQTELYIYYEVYTSAGPDAEKPLKVEYRIKSPEGKTVYDETKALERQGATGAYSHRFSSKDWGHGTYTLEMEVHDEATKKKTRTKGEFHIRWRFLLPLTDAKNYKEIVEQLQYIAKNEEMKALKDAKTPEEQRNALEAFWKRRDPTPETELNENMLTYYSRIDYANRRFTRALGKGWKSDMGRIYIIYGPPDEVERHSFEPGTNPYQLWRYHAITRTFMFVDFEGFGQYQLYRIY